MKPIPVDGFLRTGPFRGRRLLSEQLNEGLARYAGDDGGAGSDYDNDDDGRGEESDQHPTSNGTQPSSDDEEDEEDEEEDGED